MLKSLAGEDEGVVDPLPQLTKVPTHSKIQTVVKTLARVAGGRYMRIVRVPDLQEKQHSQGQKVNPAILTRYKRKYNT